MTPQKEKLKFDLHKLSKDLKAKYSQSPSPHLKPSLRPLAQELNISISTLSRVINGGMMPDINTLARLCEWMEVNPSRYFPSTNIFDEVNYSFMK